MRISPVSSFLLTVVLWACTAGSADQPRSAQESDKASKAAGKTSSRSEQSEAKCSLSPPEQVEATKRFEALMPVFHHPRCANCHGGIDFFSPSHEDTHGGGLVALEDGEVIGPDGTVIARKRPDFATCVACHDAAGPREWFIPGPLRDVSFAGRSARQICEQIKHRTRLGPKVFMDHIETDHLIGLAFEGRRGHTSLDPLPPPMAQAAFNAKVGAWLESLKAQEKWPEPLSCGCVPKGWNGIITYSDIDNLTKRKETGLTGSRRTEATIRIVAEGKGSWHGTFTGSSERKLPPCHHRGTEQYSGTGPAVLSVTGSGLTPEPDPQSPSSEGETVRLGIDIQPDGTYYFEFNLSLQGSTRGVSTGPPGECEVFDETDKEPISISTGVQAKVGSNPDRLSGSNTQPIMIGNRNTGQRVLTWNLAREAAMR